MCSKSYHLEEEVLYMCVLSSNSQSCCLYFCLCLDWAMVGSGRTFVIVAYFIMVKT